METQNAGRRVPWNKGKLTGQKPPLKLKEIWAIRAPTGAPVDRGRVSRPAFLGLTFKLISSPES